MHVPRRPPRVSQASRCLVVLGGLLCWAGVTASQARAERFKTVDGEVVIEAETYTRLAGSIGGQWSVDTLVAGYKGSGYVRSAKDDPSTLKFNSATIRAEYDIRFEQSGTYYLHLRTYAEDLTQNGFFATIDGVQFDYGHADAYYVYVKKFEKNPRWWWYVDGGGAGVREYEVSFDISSTGRKTLAIFRRDKGSRVDRIWLTKHDSSPQSSGSLALPDPATFILGATADAGSDASAADGGATPDAAGDAAEDAGVDTAEDLGLDAAEDAGVDATGDAGADAAEDTAVDGETVSDSRARPDGPAANDTTDPTSRAEVDGAGGGRGPGSVTGGCDCRVAATGLDGLPLVAALLLLGVLRFIRIGSLRLRTAGGASESTGSVSKVSGLAAKVERGALADHFAGADRQRSGPSKQHL